MDIKIFKIQNNLTNLDIAKELSLNQDYLSLILNGHRKPSAKVISKIIKLTNGMVDANSFFKQELQQAKQSKNKKED